MEVYQIDNSCETCIHYITEWTFMDHYCDNDNKTIINNYCDGYKSRGGSMKDLKKLIKDFCNEYDLGYRDDYSGRFMFGRICIGIVCDNSKSTYENLVQYLIDKTGERFIDIANALDVKYDDMGKGKIIYFPSLN